MRILYAMHSERWDQLCYRAYQRVDETLVMQLREQNRDLARSMTTSVFSGGEKITIPPLDIETALTKTVEAPPWAS